MASENPSEEAKPEPAPDPEPIAVSEPVGAPRDPVSEAPQDSNETRETGGSEPPRADTKEGTRRNRFESMLPNLIRRGIEKSIEAGLNTFEKSIETGRETTGAVREVFQEVKDVKIPREVASAVGKALSEAKLPREIASAVFGQIDDTKNDVLRIIAREFRDFLQATDIATEIKKALTSLSFEVRTEVRFIPNEAGDGVKADVRARTRVKRNPAPSPRERNLRRGKAKPKPVEADDPEDEGDDDES